MDVIHYPIVENLSTAVLVFDEALRLRYVNPAGEVMLDVSANQVSGLPVAELFPEADKLVAALRRGLAEGQPLTERKLPVTLIGLRDITVDCSVTPLSEPGQGLALLVEMSQVDHHLRVTREEALFAQQDAARAVVRGLAHEIKNPLGGLRGAAQLLERELQEESLKEYTGIIIGEADRLQNLMNRMLGPNTLPQKQLANIHQVLERVRSLVMAEAPEGVSISCDYDPSIPEFEVDPEQLIQAVLNILRNAIQALGEQGHIKLRTRAQRRFNIGHRLHKLVVRIDIIDDGPGVPEGMQEKIFYPMVTSRAEGTGLGLSIAQFLVNQHGGLIECTSRPGKTIFTLLLPLEMNDEQ